VKFTSVDYHTLAGQLTYKWQVNYSNHNTNVVHFSSKTRTQIPKQYVSGSYGILKQGKRLLQLHCFEVLLL
jgi:hypothetical protein